MILKATKIVFQQQKAHVYKIHKRKNIYIMCKCSHHIMDLDGYYEFRIEIRHFQKKRNIIFSSEFKSEFD